MPCTASTITIRSIPSTTTIPFDERAPTSKRRRGFPSETRVKRGDRAVSTPLGEKEFLEKLGREDPCPCGSGKRFQELLP